MADLLFEIGTEELPPGSVFSLTNQIKENVIRELQENNIPINKKEINTYNTPRRIAIFIANLPQKQEVKNVEIKGPDKDKAFDKENKPTQALLGFAKKYNLEPKDLVTRKINNFEYIFACVQTGGQKTIDILAKVLPNSLKLTTGNKFMCWANYNEKFARPIRWILAILDKETINFTYAGIKSSNYTFGHKFLSNKKLKINSPNDYENILNDNFVIASSNAREDIIEKSINYEAKNVNGIPSVDKDLIKEVANLTEYPMPILCSFDKEFLSLPQCVIETVLKKHQRYFVINSSNEKDKLLNNFIVISNGTEINDERIKESIKKGNEKVVKARLNDARFFFNEDLKRPFTYEDRIKDLSKITFQKGLGSMEEKTERVTKLSEYIYEMLSKQNKLKDSKEDIITCAKLCKLDLSTQMVFEMPELQGVIGGVYARKKGYSEQVCRGIEEHYINTQGNNEIAQIVGIADKLDNIIGLFAINKIPTGSTDPFALRRQAQGIIDSILDKPATLEIDISKLINFHIKGFSKPGSTDIESKVKEFFIGRLTLTLQSSFAPDLIASVCSIGNPLSNLNNTREKLKLLSIYSETKKEDFNTFLVSAKRLVRIVETKINGNIDSNNLKTDYEKQLLKHFEELDKMNPKPYSEFLNKLITLTNPINTFFDKVLVNDPDPKIRQTRQAILKKGKDLFEKICDFNQIVERSR